MDRTVVRLKPGAQFFSDRGREGLLLDGRVRMAQGGAQLLLLRALRARAQKPARLIAELLRDPALNMKETDAALALAGFILDFDLYLES